MNDDAFQKMAEAFQKMAQAIDSLNEYYRHMAEIFSEDAWEQAAYEQYDDEPTIEARGYWSRAGAQGGSIR